MSYELQYQPFPSEASLAFRYALVPWDTSAFGFPMYQLECPAESDVRFESQLPIWLATLRADKPTLVHTKIRPLDLGIARTLTRNDFYAIEVIIYFSLPLDPYVRKFKSLPDGMHMRLWHGDDLTQLLEVAGRSFSKDRFHLDPNLPNELADKRYRAWMQNAVQDQELIYVLEECKSGRLLGFALMRPTSSEVVHTSLLAMQPEYHKHSIGLMLFDIVCEQLQSEGFNQISAEASINNLPSVNLANLGFRAHSATTTYHWFHSPDGRDSK